VESAQPYANHLYFTPETQSCQHRITQFFRPGALPANQQRQSTEGNH